MFRAFRCIFDEQRILLHLQTEDFSSPSLRSSKPPSPHSGFSQTHNIGNSGIIANFVVAYI